MKTMLRSLLIGFAAGTALMLTGAANAAGLI
jgi:hypothetical protein